MTQRDVRNQQTDTQRRMPVLYQEHLILGAQFGKGLNDTLVPDAYGNAEGESEAFFAGAALTDLSGMYSLRLSGNPAAAFATTAFAGEKLPVGSCAFEAVLTGDGAITSVPLLARTGESEYAVWDLSPRGEALNAWLGFLAQVSQRGVTPFEGLSLDQVGQKMVPLLLWGRATEHVLGDYVEPSAGLPAPDCVCTCALDGRIHTLVSCLTLADQPCYLLMVPPNEARVLWRSLLSFNEVVPVGLKALLRHLGEALPWASEVLNTNDRVKLSATKLEGYDLVREESDFVGARGLRG